MILDRQLALKALNERLSVALPGVDPSIVVPTEPTSVSSTGNRETAAGSGSNHGSSSEIPLTSEFEVISKNDI